MLLCSFNQWNNVLAGWGGSKFVNPPHPYYEIRITKCHLLDFEGRFLEIFTSIISFFVSQSLLWQIDNILGQPLGLWGLGFGAPGYVQSEPIVLPTLATYSSSVITTIDRLCSATWISECLKQQNVQIRNEYLAQSC